MNMNDIILDSINIGVLILDKDYKHVYINQRGISHFNLGKILDYKREYLNCIHIDDLKIDAIKCKLFFNNNQNSTNTCRIKYDHREYKWVKITRIYNNDRYIHLLENVNELKQIMLELHNEKLKTNNDSKYQSTVLAGCHHQLVTPLNGIVGMLALLDDTQLTNEQRDYIDMLRECSVNLMVIINDILDFSKLEAGKVLLDLKCSNLRKCIESASDILSSKIYEKTIDFNYNIDSEIPDNLNIDNNRLKQIILNIVGNAIKVTNIKGSISLNVSKESSKNDIILKFSITDSGCGIPEKEFPKLFNSFSQLDNNIKNQGNGLGLVICKELVSLMNGRIWLDWSEVDKGTTFCFTIHTSECIQITEEKEQYFNNMLANRKIFILDDNRENRLGLINIVHKWGMIPHTYSSAIEALYMLKLTQSDFELGLIDIHMPEMSGKEFAIKLKQQNEDLNRKQIPLIALSSLGDIKHDYQAYFKGQLIKPVKESKLKDLCIESISNTFQYNKYIIPTPQTGDLSFELKASIHILVVEDIIINQRVVSIFLQKLGFFNIDVVDDGKKCLESMTRKKYDIILLDIRMPIMNGEDVFQYIHNYYATKSPINTTWKLLNNEKPYITAITAYSQKEDREKYLSMGFNHYISKPINIEQLEIIMNIFMKNILSN